MKTTLIFNYPPNPSVSGCPEINCYFEHLQDQYTFSPTLGKLIVNNQNIFLTFLTPCILNRDGRYVNFSTKFKSVFAVTKYSLTLHPLCHVRLSRILFIVGTNTIRLD